MNISVDSKLEINSSADSEIDNSKPSIAQTEAQMSDRAPLLPRSAWQDQRAFLNALIKAKRSLDLAEITVLVGTIC